MIPASLRHLGVILNNCSRVTQFILGLVIYLFLGLSPTMLVAQSFLYNQDALTTGNKPAGMTVVDLNADGRLDLAVANQTDNTVSVILSKSDGTFSNKVDYAVGNAPVAVVSADFNGDHIPDLAVINSQDNTVSILIGTGNGTFQNQLTYPTGKLPVAIDAVDINGDHNLDLVIANQTDGTVTVLRGNGDGTFQAQTTVGNISNPIAISSADFNGDGKPDLVINAANGQIAILLSSAGGVFTPSLITLVSSIGGMVVGDFNGDGNADIIVTIPAESQIIVMLGNGKGSFQPNRIQLLAGSPLTLTTGDFNGDGKLDLAMGYAVAFPSYSPSPTFNVLIFLGIGDGTFKQPSYIGFPGSSTIPIMEVGDFNNDGYLDIAAVDASDNQVLIELGNGDGTLGSLATLVLPGSNGVGPSVAADFNGDGKLDAAVVQINQNSTSITGFISILPGNGDGTFGQAITTQVPSIGLGDMVAGDFNGDGNEDIATAVQPTTGGISVVLGNGDGTFGTAIANPVNLPGLATQHMIVGNFNNDRNADLAVAVSNNSIPYWAVYVLLSNGDGTFQPKLVQNSPCLPSGLATGDFNHDGNMDLAITEPCTSVNPDVYVFLGHGDGTFAAPVSYSTGSLFPPTSIKTADFNGDGKLDLAVATGGVIDFFAGNGDGTFQSPVQTVLSEGGFISSVGDYNGDGIPDLLLSAPILLLGNGDGTFGRLVPLAATFGTTTTNGTSGDFNGDGVSDVFLLSSPDSTMGSPPTASFWKSTPTISLSKPLLSFGPQDVGTSSSPLPIGIYNIGNAPLAIVSITASNTFSETDSCSHSLPIGQGCSVDATFTPAVSGTSNGSLTLIDNDAPGTQILPLTGSGIAAAVLNLSPTSLTFLPQPVGSTSAPQTITLTNPGSLALQIQTISISGSFTETNTCGSSLIAGGTCTISVAFTPSASGSVSSSLTFADSAGGSLRSVPVSGVGTTFALSVQSPNITISSPGGSAMDTIQVTPISGFMGTPNLTCVVTFVGSGTATNQPTCNLSPTSGQITSASPFSTTLTVLTTATGSTASVKSLWLHSGEAFAALFFVGLFPHRRRRHALLVVILAITAGLTMNGCGGGNSPPTSPGTTAGNYTVVVTATASNITGSTTISLSLQ
jgi:hypothetical protein